MCAREDRSSGLATQPLDCELRVGPSPQEVCAPLYERLEERAVFVERRPVVRVVLLERERKIGAAFQILKEGTERAQTEGPESFEQLRSAHDHGSAYAVFGSSPLWQSGHQYAMRASSPC